MKVSIIGSGYVGLTTGICLAEMGHQVLCMDLDETKIQKLQTGEIPIYEPGLSDLLLKNSDKISFTTDPKAAIAFGKIIISAVGTPPNENHKADLKYVKAVAKSFGQNIEQYKIFVNKSTVPVGTAEICEKIIQEELEKRGLTTKFDVVSNPEFLREGCAIDDTLKPDRIVIGSKTSKAAEKLKELYGPNKTYLVTDQKSAEIIKYASNAFLATKISFINEIANFCEKSGGNVEDVAKGMGLDQRIGPRFLKAGIGYGGSCFPKDVQALIETGKEFGQEFQIIQATEKVNAEQKLRIFEKLKDYFQKNNPSKKPESQSSPLQNKTVAIWGLSFKPGTDDMREAPSITIINALLEAASIIQAYDPIATETAKLSLPESSQLHFKNSAKEALHNVDALLILTEWEEFKNFPLSEIPKTIPLFDGRNIFPPEATQSHNYHSIGRL